MTPIPPKLRKELAADPFYSVCCITEQGPMRGDRIEWHHNMIFAGRQVQKAFAILPVLQSIHARAFEPEVKERMNWVMLNRATDDELRAVSRAIDYLRERARLNAIYGPYKGAVAPPVTVPVWFWSLPLTPNPV